MEVLNNIIETTANSFDFSFCIVCNVVIYFVITIVSDIYNGSPVKEWTKRLITLIVIVIMGILYCLDTANYRVVLNSAIITPVFWTWVIKPIIKFIGYDYKHKTIKRKRHEFH